jgi:hypothetical protein
VGAGFDATEVLEFFGWPAMKYEKPEPPTIVAPPGQGEEPGKSEEEPPPGKKDDA